MSQARTDAARTNTELRPGDPICGNCGYLLRDLIESARCPECGKPLVEVLTRHGTGVPGAKVVRKRSKATLFGLPVVDIAIGPRPEFGERRGTAKGIIAIGDVAYGGIAFGGAAFGVVTFGGVSIGMCSLGGLSIGLLTAAGGGALGGIAVGGGTIGGLATGGGAVGYVAQGGGALGVYARGPGAIGTHVISPRRTDQAAIEMFSTLSPVMGVQGPTSGSGMIPPLVTVLSVTAVVAMLIGLVALWAHRRHARSDMGAYGVQ